MALDAERQRLAEVPRGRAPWRHWGPYLSERSWGTVREDYSADGEPWSYFPHDHARSRVYRWNEDGLAGICDDQQTLCLALAFWNERDPVLKERIFGLTGTEGNHGEDAKEYWWYLDSTPTHSWMRWRYMYPQAAFPYRRLLDENRARGRLEPEFELLDTGIFDDGYFEITADYAKASPEDVLLRLTVHNRGTEAATLHVLPTLWFRNTWAFAPGTPVPELRREGDAITACHAALGRRVLVSDGPAHTHFCDNETNAERLYGTPNRSAYPKDGIGDHVLHGAQTVNPEHTGTKAAFHHVLTIAAGRSVEIRLRLAPDAADLGAGFAAVMAQREHEADAFYAALLPAGAGVDRARVMRQAFAGMLWSKQFYHYNVRRWWQGDPGQPSPPPQRVTGRNHGWQHLHNRDVISMPDTWEYPWYAAWDLAFHCVVLAHVDVEFAKSQLLLLCREWFMHPNGQLPAYEWDFSDVNPPVHAWAALRVFAMDGGTDFDFLERIFHKLLLNFTWWVNRKDSEGNNVFEGGFLGLDNIGPFDRSHLMAMAGHLDQADGTAWMAKYSLNLLEIALVLARHDHTYEDLATKFFEHFTYIAAAMRERGIWDEGDGFFYDVVHGVEGTTVPLRARSMVGLIPLCATTTLGADTLDELPEFAARLRWFLANETQFVASVALELAPGHRENRLLSLVGPESLRRMLAIMLSEDEFLSPHGLRSVSRWHRQHPLDVQLGPVRARLGYEPAESETGLFGGNSNWRGPVWFPLNYLIINALRRFHAYLGDDFTIEHPTASGRQRTLAEVAEDLSERLIGLFLDVDGHRAVFGGAARLQSDAAWHDLLPFHEYFHGDTGAGLGASHQTGWTALVADLIIGPRHPL